MQLTENEKRNRIIDNWNENTFVEAGAGAGKTTLIVNRVVRQLQNGIKPEELVIITFTNKAAEELRSRITLAIKDTGLNQDGFDMDLMQISTIHSFCFTILKERAFDAKLPIDVKLLEEGENQSEIDSLFEKWLECWLSSDWDYLDTIDMERKDAIGYIYGMYKEFTNLPSDAKVMLPNQTMPEAQFNKDADILIDGFVKHLLSEMVNVDGKHYSSPDELPQDLFLAKGKSIVEALAKTQRNNTEIIQLISKPASGKKDFIRKKGVSGESAEDIDARITDYYKEEHKAEFERLSRVASENKYQPLVKFAVKAVDFYRKNVTRTEVNNNLLIEMAKTLVCESEDARKYFADKFKCIYVDEFQDTDHIQETLIWNLALDTNNSPKLRDGALFLVGDPKQSIYRFRGAEPEVYFTTKAKMAACENVSVYELSDNYRTSQPVIDWVNQTFANKQIISGGSYIPMNVKKPLAADANLIVGMYKNALPESVDISKEADMKNLADLIQGLVNAAENGKKKYKITDYRFEKDGTVVPYSRDIRFSDILVLCTTKNSMKDYLGALSAAKIPVNITGKDNLIAAIEVEAFVKIFAHLACPGSKRDMVSVIEVLKKTGAVKCEDDVKNVAKPLLKKLRENTRGMSAYGVAEYLIGQLPYLMVMDKEYEDFLFDTVRGKLHQLVEKVIGDASLTRVAMADALNAAASEEIERMLVLEESFDAVRFMNLHKAKGLEGNIVIYTAREESRSFRHGSVKIGDKYYPSLMGQYSRMIWSSYTDVASIEQKAEDDETSERIRLEYVAVTRAKQAFIFMDCLNANALFTDDYGLDSLESVKNIIDEGKGITFNSQVPVGLNGKCFTKLPEKAGFKNVSPSQYEARVSETRELARSHWDKEILAQEKLRPTGNILGTALHRALELFVERSYRQPDAKEEILGACMKSCVMQAIMESSDEIIESERNSFEQFIYSVIKAFSDWAKQVGLFDNAMDVYTELPFSYYEEKVDFENKPIWMNGSADLVVKKENGDIVVIDYKSDHDSYMTEEETVQSLKEKYYGQLTMYQHSLAKIFNVAKEQIALHILSFSYKDEEGRSIGENIRVRETIL